MSDLAQRVVVDDEVGVDRSLKLTMEPGWMGKDRIIGQDRIFWMAVRQAVLMFLDALERWLTIEPRTAELRKEAKREQSDSLLVRPERPTSHL
jgi:hypothetical protein